MCGIFGYTGKGLAYASLLEGLSRLEYRGYDSCGMAAVNKNKLFLRKRAGKINQHQSDLQNILSAETTLALLHIRWATHGRPNRANAHPHWGCDRRIAVVHNGIIENFLQLKQELKAQGHKFLSETDSEVVAHLIEKFYRRSLTEAVFKTVDKLKGSFALGVIALREPDKLIAARKDSPLIIGRGPKGLFLASDMPALLTFSKQAVYLKNREVAVLTGGKINPVRKYPGAGCAVFSNGINIFDFKKKPVRPALETVKLKPEAAEKKGYPHFMLKEIFEQPRVLDRIFSLYSPGQKIHFPQMRLPGKFLKSIDKIYVTACGTAYHAGYVAKYFLEKTCPLSLEIDTSSEFRYRKLSLDRNSLLIAISQSGETADTLAAVREAKKCGAKILSICNVLGSSLVKESDGFIATLAGPEIGVASTKAYTAQVCCLYLFSLYLARLKGSLNAKNQRAILNSLKRIPDYQGKILKKAADIKKIARAFSRLGSFLFLGRGINYPSALEGALKLKEISYIPAEGYPAGEMKHGPIALIDEYRAVVCIAPRDELHEKMVSNMQEVKARKGKILAILNCADNEAHSLSHKVICIPPIDVPD